MPPGRTRVLSGSIDRIGDVLRPLGIGSVFVVTDPGIVRCGHAGRMLSLLIDCRASVSGFDAVRENPSKIDVDRCSAALDAAVVDRFGGKEPECVLAIGGGSAIDVAKAAILVRAGGGSIEDYRGVGSLGARVPPLIAVPTTAGTGSEVQSFALISDESTHEKFACGDAAIAPRVALLDAELTRTMPRHVTASTGLDTIGHALEALVTTKGSDVSRRAARDAFVLAASAFDRVLTRADDLEAREAMLQSSSLAGLAIENSMLGAAHSIANALTAKFEMAHGEAVALALPEVVRFNSVEPAARALYREAAFHAGAAQSSDSDDIAIDRLIEQMYAWIGHAGIDLLASRLRRDVHLRDLAEVASRQWTARFNPRAVDRSAFETILEAMIRART
ncbi:MAG: iron-containing alcohol dehydrogenase [Planctomycetes bacterium]|nr:iron-containing alcohol dehydrogenase [Planctomycetota bacterium]MCB9890492.1 iron-containing alcohol dehydrogenase [Planctomycetota bacterium]MCB9917733.1 iron-containing alcohol dehydrogenase [Planctomycetota bacterium]